MEDGLVLEPAFLLPEDEYLVLPQDGFPAEVVVEVVVLVPVELELGAPSPSIRWPRPELKRLIADEAAD